MLNHRNDFNLGLEKILFMYNLKRHRSDKYFFIADTKSIQLVMNFSNARKSKALAL